jgi:hypothetical protein
MGFSAIKERGGERRGRVAVVERSMAFKARIEIQQIN